MARAGGIGRYAVNLVRAVLTMAPAYAPGLEFVLFTAPQMQRGLLTGLEARYQEHACAGKSSLLRALVTIPQGTARQQLHLWHGLDQVGFPYVGTRARHLVTLHDIAPLLVPQCFPLKHRLVVRALLSRVATQAHRVIVPSQAVQRDVAQHLRIPAQRIIVIPEGCEARFTPEDDPMRQQALRQRYRLPPAYLLFVGTLEPRKNLPTLLRAFARVRQTVRSDPALHLVLAGAYGWREPTLAQQVQALGLEQVVHFPGFIADEDLPDLYRGARLFVFPSLYEGFGLPVLEATACGVPVVTSNVSALPEVAGDGALLVAPRDVEGLAAAMRELFYNTALRAQVRQKGLERARALTWEQAARQTLEVYRDSL